MAVEAPEESGNLIDLMAALEASVKSAKAARESSSDKPVSVSEAKAAKASGKAAAAKAKPAADEDAEEAKAKPAARKRKTA